METYIDILTYKTLRPWCISEYHWFTARQFDLIRCARVCRLYIRIFRRYTHFYTCIRIVYILCSLTCTHVFILMIKTENLINITTSTRNEYYLDTFVFIYKLMNWRFIFYYLYLFKEKIVTIQTNIIKKKYEYILWHILSYYGKQFFFNIINLNIIFRWK